MNGDRSENALTRIEAALARLEAAVKRPLASADGIEAAQLHRKHEKLRAAVTQSLRQLDGLIGGGQR